MNSTPYFPFRLMPKKLWAFALFLSAALAPGALCQAGAEANPSPLAVGPVTPWVSIPAGARVTYIGIHGGTVPVSLLTDKDGTSMVTFVGQTGNDFLRILLRTGAGEVNEHTPPLHEALNQAQKEGALVSVQSALPPAKLSGDFNGPLLPVVGALPATDAEHPATTHPITMPPASNATVLMAETAVGNIPVIYVTGKGFARMDGSQWLPFGLSEKPLQLEGQVVKPIGVTKLKKQRRFSLPKSLKSPT